MKQTWKLPHPHLRDSKLRVWIQEFENCRNRCKKSRDRCKKRKNAIQCLYINNSNDSQKTRDQTQLCNNSWTEALNMKGMKVMETASSWHRMSLTRLRNVMLNKTSHHRNRRCLQLKTILLRSKGSRLNLLPMRLLFRRNPGFQTKSTRLIREEYREDPSYQITSKFLKSKMATINDRLMLSPCKCSHSISLV